MGETPLVEIVDGVKNLPNGESLLRPIDVRVRHGESVAIVGRSGSGKSTLLSVLGLLDTIDGGLHAFDGRAISNLRESERDHLRGHDIGFVFQRFALFPHLTAIENVLVPLRHTRTGRESQLVAAARNALEEVGMDAAAKKRPRQLSGGEQQRVAIARALITDPKLILADEPTGSLDQANGDTVVQLLIDRVRDRGAGLIVVTHERDVAARMNRTLHLAGGRLHDAEPVVGMTSN